MWGAAEWGLCWVPSPADLGGCGLVPAVHAGPSIQNYKKRVEKEKRDLYSYANEKIMGDLLTVMDNFERALEHDADETFKEGIEMIFKQLSDVLEKDGLAEIPALGEEFDPNVHSAVMTEETEDYESGKVSGVMQKGYTLNGKVIRPAMVKVAN